MTSVLPCCAGHDGDAGTKAWHRQHWPDNAYWLPLLHASKGELHCDIVARITFCCASPCGTAPAMLKAACVFAVNQWH